MKRNLLIIITKIISQPWNREVLFFRLMVLYGFFVFLLQGVDVRVLLIGLVVCLVLQKRCLFLFFCLSRKLNLICSRIEYIVGFVTLTYGFYILAAVLCFYVLALFMTVMRKEYFESVLSIYAFLRKFPSGFGSESAIVIYIPVLQLTENGEMSILLQPNLIGVAEGLLIAGVSCLAAAGAMTWSGLDDDKGDPIMLTERISSRHVRNFLVISGLVVTWVGLNWEIPVAPSSRVVPLSPQPVEEALVPNSGVNLPTIAPFVVSTATEVMAPETLSREAMRLLYSMTVLTLLDFGVNPYESILCQVFMPRYGVLSKFIVRYAIQLMNEYKLHFNVNDTEWLTLTNSNYEMLREFERVYGSATYDVRLRLLTDWKLGFENECAELSLMYDIVKESKIYSNVLLKLFNINTNELYIKIRNQNRSLLVTEAVRCLISPDFDLVSKELLHSLIERHDRLGLQVRYYLQFQRNLGVPQPYIIIPTESFIDHTQHRVTNIHIFSEEEFRCIAKVERTKCLNVIIPRESWRPLGDLVQLNGMRPVLVCYLKFLYYGCDPTNV